MAGCPERLLTDHEPVQKLVLRSARSRTCHCTCLPGGMFESSLLRLGPRDFELLKGWRCSHDVLALAVFTESSRLLSSNGFAVLLADFVIGPPRLKLRKPTDL